MMGSNLLNEKGLWYGISVTLLWNEKPVNCKNSEWCGRRRSRATVWEFCSWLAEV